MSDNSWEVHGVTVRQSAMGSGPVWRWDVAGPGNLTLHHEIQWVQSAPRWVRRSRITDGRTEGGWNAYAVKKYRAAYDQDEAEAFVRELLDRELGPGGQDYP